VKGVAGIDVSIGTVGDAHNNSLAEIHQWVAQDGVDQAAATLEEC
jgi:hypothetical protein